jgi:hypothetical protein
MDEARISSRAQNLLPGDSQSAALSCRRLRLRRAVVGQDAKQIIVIASPYKAGENKTTESRAL